MLNTVGPTRLDTSRSYFAKYHRRLLVYIALAPVAMIGDTSTLVYTGAFEDNRSFRNHAWLRFTYIFDHLITDYLQTHRI